MARSHLHGFPCKYQPFWMNMMNHVVMSLFFEPRCERSSRCVSGLREMLEDATLAAYFRVLGFDTSDGDLLFSLLDTDDSGNISMEAGDLRL